MLRCSGATTFLFDVVLGVFAVILLGAYLSFVLGQYFTLSSTVGSSGYTAVVLLKAKVLVAYELCT